MGAHNFPTKPEPELLDRALLINASGPRIHDVRVDASVAITCECAARATFVTRLTVPGVCPACRRRYPIDVIHVKPTAPGHFEVSVNVTTQIPKEA